jgi:outer membrane lipoprotein-sorting protein
MESMTIPHKYVKVAVTIASFLSLAAYSQEHALESPRQGDAAVATGDPAARSLVERADRIRFPAESFQVDVGIVTNKAGQEPETRKYRVLSKGNDNTVVMVTEPASERGQIILMKGRDLWIFMPDVSQPIRIALSQRLTGQVANGDLARANFAGDYHPRLLRTETIDSETYNVLELTAVDRGVTYQKVIYWVGQKNDWPFKAEFYSLSNRLLKTCKYENYRTMEGQPRPTRLVMEDAMRGGEQSVLEYENMKLRELPDKIFTKDYLKKLD